MAAYNDDLKTFKILVEAGCDLHYNGTATKYYVYVSILNLMIFILIRWHTQDPYWNNDDGDDDDNSTSTEYYDDYDYGDDGPYVEAWMDGVTMLHICAMEGSLEVMEYLLTIPEVDVDARDGHMETPVYFAAYWGWYEVFIIMIWILWLFEH